MIRWTSLTDGRGGGRAKASACRAQAALAELGPGTSRLTKAPGSDQHLDFSPSAPPGIPGIPCCLRAPSPLCDWGEAAEEAAPVPAGRPKTGGSRGPPGPPPPAPRTYL